MFAYAGEQMVATIRRRLFRSMLVQEVQFFDTCRTGELISRLSSDTVVLKDAVTSDIAMACVIAKNPVVLPGTLRFGALPGFVGPPRP
jgi:ABC-type multidrug transport system fused ATPase/permease subunit